MKNNNSKKKGFTLIELLVTIVILAVILSVGGYFVTNAISKGKEKSYKVTLNEISSNANNYMIERSGELFFIQDMNNLKPVITFISIQIISFIICPSS